MRHMFFVVIGFYFFITITGILFMGSRLFVVENSVGYLTEAQKSLIKRLELRDIVYRLRDAVIDAAVPESEITILKSKLRAIAGECRRCHHSPAVTVRIKNMEKSINQSVKKLNGNNSYRRDDEKTLITTGQVIPFAEDAYLKAVSLSEIRLGQVRQELYRIRGTGIVVSLVGLFLFLGFSAVSLGRISRLQSETKEKERKLIQSEKLSALGRVIAGVAHEITTPIHHITGYSELLMKRSEDASIKDMADRVRKSAMRIANIVNDLLVFSGTSKLERAEVNIKDMITETLAGIHEALIVNKISVSVDVADDISVSMDGVQMERVLFNLLINAIHALRDSGKGDEIRLKAFIEDKSNKVIIEVSDNGPGIPDRIIDKIFDPFFTTKRLGKGTGLGLGICSNIIKAHGGDIRVRSIEGEGTAFAIELPMRE